MGRFALLSTCGRCLEEPLELHSWSHALLLSIARELGIALEALQGNVPHPTLRGKSHDFSKLRQEAWASSRVPTGTSGNLSYFLREVRSPFEL